MPQSIRIHSEPRRYARNGGNPQTKGRRGGQLLKEIHGGAESSKNKLIVWATAKRRGLLRIVEETHFEPDALNVGYRLWIQPVSATHARFRRRNSKCLSNLY